MADPPRATRRRTGRAMVIAAALALLLTWAEAVGAAGVTRLDMALSDFTRGWADTAGWPVDVAGLIGRLTAPSWSAAAAAVLVLVLYAAGYRATAALLASCGLAGLAVSELVKRLMSRSRPPGADLFVSDLDRSFPSGHAMVGIYLYLIAGVILVHLGRATARRLLPPLGVLLVAFGPVIGLSRLVLGVHWPSDVLAGWAFGSAVVCAAAFLLWAPVGRDWTAIPAHSPAGPHGGSTDDSAGSDGPDALGISDPEPPGAGATPDPPGR